MKEGFDRVHNKRYAADSVIARGYEIYDEWVGKKFSSRRIASLAERAASSVRVKKTAGAYTEALAVLFALDMRVKEKYGSLLRCLLSYFSWRRETGALRLLKGALNIPFGESDVRSAIEVALATMRERIDDDKSEDGDDETHGGKRNGRSEEEATSTREKGQEQTAENSPEDTPDAEEKQESEEKKSDDTIEQTEEQAEERGEREPANREAREASEITVREEIEAPDNEEQIEQKEENVAPEEMSESTADKSTEQKTENAVYNDATDHISLFEESKSEKSASDRLSFIDEVIMDNIVKGKDDIVMHNPLDDIRQNRETQQFEDTTAQRSDEVAHKDDKPALDGKQSDTGRFTQATEKTDSSPTVQVNEQAQSNAAPVENAPTAPVHTEQAPTVEVPAEEAPTVQAPDKNEELRVPIQVDISVDAENEMRRGIFFDMTPEALNAYIDAQKDAMREHIEIVSEEFLRESSTEISEKTSESPTAQTTVTPKLK